MSESEPADLQTQEKTSHCECRVGRVRNKIQNTQGWEMLDGGSDSDCKQAQWHGGIAHPECDNKGVTAGREFKDNKIY